MIDPTFARANTLKQNLLTFVLEAEGELAIALEAYSAAQLLQSTRGQYQALGGSEMVVDTFLAEGRIGEQTPIDYFLAETEFDPAERQLVQGWKQSFPGLFGVVQILEDELELMNWLTAKHYRVRLKNSQEQEKLARLKPGEVLLARISPVIDTIWMFSNPFVLLGKLGKPKLAVAIGNFKQQYRRYLYSDALELLEEAWQSVEQYHQNFVDFFGCDEITLPGYQLEKKLSEFQHQISQQRLQTAGIDGSKSLATLAEEAGVSQEEITETAETLGADAKTVQQFLNQPSPAMVAPKVELPAALRKAEQVTVLTHPRWGQLFLPTYPQLVSTLSSDPLTPQGIALLQQALEDTAMNAFVWQRLATQFPSALQTGLRTVLGKAEFDLSQDLTAVLATFHKPAEPELPEIASVPLHLHHLFQEALLEVQQERPKSKGNRKAATGFGRRS